jgi:hypothetical protein
VGHALGVAGRSEDAEHAASGHRGEEVLEVEAHHHGGPRVRRGVAARRPTRDEPVRRVVGGDAVEHLAQHAPLRGLEHRLGLLDQSRRRSLRDSQV